MANASATTNFTASNTTENGQELSDDEARFYNDPWFVLGRHPAGFKCLWMFCGFLSTISCFVLLREALKDVSARGRIRNRAVQYQHATMAVAYGIFSIVQMLGPLPAPSQLDDWGPIGSFGTCSVQGFFLVLGITSASFTNASIILLFMLIVKYNWSDDRLLGLLKKINVVVVLYALTVAILPLTFEGYNYASHVCQLASLPIQCRFDEDVECLRGPGPNHTANNIHFILDPVVQGTCMLSVIVNFCFIYHAVRQTEDRSGRHVFAVRASAAPMANRSKSIAVFREARLFCCLFGAVLVSYVLYLLNVLGRRYQYFHFSIVALLGFFVCLVYMKRRPTMKTPEGRLLRKIIWFPASSVQLLVIQPLRSALEHRTESRENTKQTETNLTASSRNPTTAAEATSGAEDPTTETRLDSRAADVRAGADFDDPELDLDSYDPMGLAPSHEYVALDVTSNDTRDSAAQLSGDAEKTHLLRESGEAKEEISQSEEYALEQRAEGRENKKTETNLTASTQSSTVGVDVVSGAEDLTIDVHAGADVGAHSASNDPELNLGSHDAMGGLAPSHEYVALDVTSNELRDSAALLSGDAEETQLRLESDEEAKEEISQNHE